MHGAGVVKYPELLLAALLAAGLIVLPDLVEPTRTGDGATTRPPAAKHHPPDVGGACVTSSNLEIHGRARPADSAADGESRDPACQLLTDAAADR